MSIDENEKTQILFQWNMSIFVGDYMLIENERICEKRHDGEKYVFLTMIP